MNAPRTASTVCEAYFSVAAIEDLSWTMMQDNAKVRKMSSKKGVNHLFYIQPIFLGDSVFKQFIHRLILI